jgi:CRISPR/Cas system-associated exonuclease Cas4 (RecB family)
MRQILELLSQYWFDALVLLFLFFITLKITLLIADRIYQSSLPETKFGFRGKLIYSDDSPNAEVFVNHRYELSAKPDFIFRIGLFKYAIVEFKSRVGQVKQSDTIQVIASIIAARSKFNITEAYIVTGRQTKIIEASSSARLYRELKPLHKKAKQVKFRNQLPKRLSCSKKCDSCGYKEHCFSES